MSTHPVRRFYPGLRAQRRYHPGADPLGAFVRDVVSRQHRSQRVASDPLGILATSVQMCENLGAKRSPRTASTVRGHGPLGFDPAGNSAMNSEIDSRFGQVALRTFTVNSSSRPARSKRGAR
jgi:hypothetical protein